MSSARYDTMLRLHECDCHTPPPPFPSPVIPISLFEEMMYKVAFASGYAGTKSDFQGDLAKALNNAQQVAGIIIQKGSYKDFPDIGIENAIYIDTEKKNIYFWKDEGYYKVDAGQGDSGEESGPVIPSDGLIYDGGEL